MGGHGGLNILPQKRWNVYNYDNREKVRRDEEAAAREEQLKREQARKRDAEFRLERLRTARGLAPLTKQPAEKSETESESEPKTNHINLFEGIKIFDPIEEPIRKNNKKVKKEEEVRVVTKEDEKYRLGYGVAGKGVKLPWYMEKRRGNDDTGEKRDNNDDNGLRRGKSGKKTLEELREERLKREQLEKERERAVLDKKMRDDSFKSGGFSRRR